MKGSDRIPPGEHPDGRPAPAPGESGPREDAIAADAGRNRGRGANRVHTRYTAREAAVDLLTAYKWPLVIGGFLVFVSVVALAVTGNLPEISIPPITWSLAFYVLAGSVVALGPAYLIQRYFDTVEGVEVLDIDPVTGSHRHLRIGNALWDDLVVKSPWGSIVSKDELSDCSINGLSGYEMMDLRVLDDGTPICVAPWVGEASGAQMRTYRMAFNYARSRLARRAERATTLRANIGELARESAERMVARHVVRSEKTGMPHGEEIDSVIDGVMSEAGLSDPLDMDLGDGPDELGRDVPGGGDPRDDHGDRGDREHRENGHAENGHAHRVEDVDGIAATDGGQQQ